MGLAGWKELADTIVERKVLYHAIRQGIEAFHDFVRGEEAEATIAIKSKHHGSFEIKYTHKPE